MDNKPDSTRPGLQLWGGLECTVNRVLDEYFSQMERNGHARRGDDLQRFASLGIRAIRYPVLWEHIAPHGLDKADWSWPDERLSGLRELGITPIVGLLHHGSGPRHTSLIDPAFPERLAEFAAAVARRYPWVDDYTPVNEPLTTARFSGLYGVWYPHGRDDATFVRALLNQCRGVVLAMQAIREVNPRARLVQTDDLSKTYGTPELAGLADFFNERRWLSWDLLCGKVVPEHALWDYLIRHGATPQELLWFGEQRCAPDVIGVNYYITSERWLDTRTERYPSEYLHHYAGRRYADIEAVRVLETSSEGIAPLLRETWERYRLPVAVTEAHIDANREDQLRWLLEIWRAAERIGAEGADIRAVTVWALLGSFDWNCLVTACKGYYEPGPYDVRSEQPRPTAVATLMRELASGRTLSHPVLEGQGWWRRPGRFYAPPVALAQTEVASPEALPTPASNPAPILISGGRGTLAMAFARICEQRNLQYRLLHREEMDIADPASVERAVAAYEPWAIINAGGYVKVDQAQNEVERCFRDNTLGPSVLAGICARDGIQLLTFSSDLVFDGRRHSPYVEDDTVAPLNNYGQSKADAERAVLDRDPGALVVRSSAFFGPWDTANFVTRALHTLSAGQPFAAANDLTVTPTYVPDLVHASLDLLIDRAAGIWHLSNSQPVTWASLALIAADRAGVDPSRLEAQASNELNYIAPRPAYSALSSKHGTLLPTLDDALSRYLQLQRDKGRQCPERAIRYGGR